MSIHLTIADSLYSVPFLLYSSQPYSPSLHEYAASYTLTCWWIFGVLPVYLFCYYKQCCYEHSCIHLLVHIWMNSCRVSLAEELLIYKIKSNCFQKKYGFTLPWAMYESSCSTWSATLLLSNLKIFANLMGVKMHHCELWWPHFFKKKKS